MLKRVSEIQERVSLRTLAVVAILLLWLVPIFGMFYISLKPTRQLIVEAFWSLPNKIAILDNVLIAWEDASFESYAINSLIYASIAAPVGVFLASLGAYVIAVLQPRFKNLLLYAILLFTFFPFQMYLIPLVKAYNMTNLYNTRIGLTLVYIAVAIPFAAFILRNYFVTLPQSLYEAARIDGLNDFEIYYKLYVPLAIPGFAVALIFQWVYIWNEFLFGLVLTTDESARPIATGLASLTGRAPRWSVLAVATLMTVIPAMILFMFAQRYFERGLMSGVGKR
jgi:multiple sugar transport system permease protein